MHGRKKRQILKMYLKSVKAGGKTYKYYYHNVKIGKRVKNICLASDAQKALAILAKIRKERKRAKRPLSVIVKNCRESLKKGIGTNS